ncbi:MAG: OadG family protein [Kiritimatiellae bacterium]|nr:OadG family protein [Kiritimatiellia bacterium]
MDRTELIKQGVVLLISGMGIVYFFLAVLVAVTTLSAKIIPRFNHILPDEAPKKKPAPKAASNDDEAIAIAIAVARSR